MGQTISLDGATLYLDADPIVVDLAIPGLEEVNQEHAPPWVRCRSGEAMEPVACYQDGTIIFFRCPPEGEPEGGSYQLESARPHHWTLRIEEAEAEDRTKRRIATIRPEVE